ncbi:MAG6090-like repeat-containing lipoprotein [Mycoplasmopsis agalactiae]|uniref:Lipoprotein n=1 Tax=Mycoplasmopsis agalactiae TaxID=2110 RepID=D3VRD8_MYCAA|nr:hypothetical protein [Mycoplasmopsis agalactiae]CBH40885.1 Hypothetical protein, predicted lipoprotein [Mycoplasmopsis agalactiae]
MRKKLLLSSGILALSSPLLSSACYVANVWDKPADNHSDWKNPPNHSGSNATKLVIIKDDDFDAKHINMAVNEILEDNLKLNLAKLNELKAANVIAKIFDDTYTDAIKEIERKAKADEAKEKDKVDKEIELIDHKISASDITGELFALLTKEIDKASIEKAEKANLDKQQEWVDALLKEIKDLNEQVASEMYAYSIAKKEEYASILTKKIFEDSDADKIKDAEKRYAKELADKLKVYNNHRTKSSNTTADLFSDDWLREIEKAKRDKEISSKIYNDSASGLDINIHWTKEDLERWVKKALKDNLKLNLDKLNELKAANVIAKIFDDTYTDEIKEIERKAKAEEAKEAVKVDAEIGLTEHLISSSDITGELFALLTKEIDKASNEKAEKANLDKQQEWVDALLKEIKDLNEKVASEMNAYSIAKKEEYASRVTGELFSNDHLKDIEKAKRDREISSRIYNDSASGLDIKIHWTKEDLERWTNKILRDNWDLNKVTLDKIESANITGKIFDDTYTDAIKEIERKAKAEEDREAAKAEAEIMSIDHKVAASDITGELFALLTKEIDKASIEKAEKANLDKQQEWVDALLKEIKDLNEQVTSEMNAYSIAKKEEYASRVTGELFSNDHLMEIEKAKRDREISSKIYNDSASGLDIKIHWTKEDLERWTNKVLRDNWDLNKGTLDKIESANITGKIFDDTYTDAIKEALERKARAEEAREAAKAEAEIKLIDHKVSASDITGELFSDEHQKWVEKVKNNIKARIYRDSKSGLDIDLHPTDAQIESENKRLDDEAKKIIANNRRVNKEFVKSWLNDYKNRIFRDSPSGLDINWYSSDKMPNSSAISEISIDDINKEFLKNFALEGLLSSQEGISEEDAKEALSNIFDSENKDEVISSFVNSFFKNDDKFKNIKSYSKLLSELISKTDDQKVRSHIKLWLVKNAYDEKTKLFDEMAKVLIAKFNKNNYRIPDDKMPRISWFLKSITRYIVSSTNQNDQETGQLPQIFNDITDGIINMLKSLNDDDNILAKTAEGAESGESKFITENGFISFAKVFKNVDIFKKIFENTSHKAYADFVNIMFKYADGFDDKGLYHEIFNSGKKTKLAKSLWLEKGGPGLVHHGIFKIMSVFIKPLIKNYVNELYESTEIYTDPQDVKTKVEGYQAVWRMYTAFAAILYSNRIPIIYWELDDGTSESYLRKMVEEEFESAARKKELNKYDGHYNAIGLINNYSVNPRFWAGVSDYELNSTDNRQDNWKYARDYVLNYIYYHDKYDESYNPSKTKRMVLIEDLKKGYMPVIPKWTR